MPSHASSSLPGLTRQSILFAKEMDARVKPAHDEWANPSRRRTAVALAFVSFLALSFSSSGLAQDAVADFYRGKQINLIVGYGPGGGYDTAARVLARHLGRYIPGNPSIVVQNMPGAGSMRAANYLYGIAPKDGTAFALFGSDMALIGLMGTNPSVAFDPRNFTGNLRDDARHRG